MTISGSAFDLVDQLTPDSFGAMSWAIPALVVVAILAGLALWSYLYRGPTASVRTGAAMLKIGGVMLIAFCLLEPLKSGKRPRPGANLFGIVVDNSQSMRMKSPQARRDGRDQLAQLLRQDASWRTRLEQDFDVRTYAFDARLQTVTEFDKLEFDGRASGLRDALETIGSRLASRPVAGVLLVTDGNATDLRARATSWSRLGFPVYPVVDERRDKLHDIRITNVAITQTNFEAAPISATLQAEADGFEDAPLIAKLVDPAGEPVERQTLTAPASGERIDLRFSFRPSKPGVQFYRVEIFPASEERRFDRGETRREVTLANNSRVLAVDRGGGPYRVLYLAGRPNWEFKFLRRALQEDDEVNLVAMLRIARKEARFSFRDRTVESKNRLFEGFDAKVNDDTEQYDEPVLVRLGIESGEELKAGFPKTAEQLFAYHAVILDDMEVGFFKPDQMHLLRRFVSARGAGLLMLGGQESFLNGGFDRTPLGEMTPLYLNKREVEQPTGPFRLELTREGWLQPWTRLRATETAERQRMGEMPPFQTLNMTGTLKPGASVLATVSDVGGNPVPALVTHRFGKGRSAALLIGDFWRWAMHRKVDEQKDLEQAWRQTVRWLVSDVPRRVEVDVKPADSPGQPVPIEVTVRDEEYQPLDNATVELKVTTPRDDTFTLSAEPSDTEAGIYIGRYWPPHDGGYKVEAIVNAPDGSEVARREAGWASQPGAAEYRTLAVNRKLLDQIAQETGGEVIQRGDLPAFVKGLPNRKVPITEDWVAPFWHQAWLFGLAIAMLCGEWGIRRWKGLP